MAVQLSRSKAVLAAFVILGLAPFAYAATRAWFWQHEYRPAPVAAACYLLILTALVVGRYRWAWVLLAVLYGVGILDWSFRGDRFGTRWLLGLAYDLVTFALLASSPMRSRLRRPVTIRPRRQHVSLG
jgi:hypothetical protein